MKSLAIVIALVCSPCSVFARAVNDMSFEAQKDRADLVALARPTSTKRVGDIIDLPNIRRMRKGGGSSAIKAIGRETEFEVLSIFKGNPSLKKFVLHHYYLLNPRDRGGNDPELVSFNKWTLHPFLLYLKRDGDGRYSAVVGQTDPGFSIFLLGGAADGCPAGHYEPCH